MTNVSTLCEYENVSVSQEDTCAKAQISTVKLKKNKTEHQILLFTP